MYGNFQILMSSNHRIYYNVNDRLELTDLHTNGDHKKIRREERR